MRFSFQSILSNVYYQHVQLSSNLAAFSIIGYKRYLVCPCSISEGGYFVEKYTDAFVSRKLTDQRRKWQLSTYISVKPALIWWYRLLSRKLCALSDLGWYTAQIPTWHSIHSSLRASLSTRQKSDRWLAGWFIQARNATSLHRRLSFHHLNRPQSRRINPPPVCFCLRFPLLGSGMLLCAAFAGKPIYRYGPFSLPSISQQRSLSNEAGCVLWKIRPRYSNIAIWLRLQIFCDVRRCLVRRGARATSPDLLSRREKFLPLDLGVMASWRILWTCTIGVVCRFCICSRIVTFDLPRRSLRGGVLKKHIFCQLITDATDLDDL